MSPDKDKMISQMEQARRSLNDALDKIAPQVEIYPTWKLKQVMDHIAGWDELTVSSLLAYARGKAVPKSVKHGIDHFNIESISARKDLTLEQSRLAYDTARLQVLQVLRELPPDMLTQKYPAPWGGMCTVASIVKIFVSHELEHAKQIQEVLVHPA